MDVSKLSDEEILQALQAPAQPAGGDLSAMSDDDLMAALNSAPPAIGANNAAMQSIQQGLTFGFGDELMAGLMTPVEAIKGAVTGEDTGKGVGQRISDSYDRNLTRERGRTKQAREEHPVISTVGEVAGGLVTGGQLAKGGATLLNVARPTMPAMIGRGAAEGALYGAAYGAGEGEGFDDRLDRAVKGGAVGGVMGGALGAVGARGAQRAAEKAVPGAEALKGAANVTYKNADDIGLQFKPQGFAQSVDDISTTVATAGIDPTIHPKATAALGRLKDVGEKPMTLKNFDTLRRVVGAAAKSQDADERRIAGIMIDKLDDFLDNIPATDVISGNPNAASALIKNARELWSRARKTEVIDEIYRRIDLNTPMFSGSGRENAVRSEFRALAKRKDFKRMFKPAEQKAIEKVAKGGPTENALRWLGKLAPTGVVSGGISGGVGFALGGPMGAAATMGAGAAGRSAATAMTNANARAAETMIRNGGIAPSLDALTGPQRAAMELLMKGSAPQDSRAGGILGTFQ